MGGEVMQMSSNLSYVLEVLELTSKIRYNNGGYTRKIPREEDKLIPLPSLPGDSQTYIRQ